MYSRTKMPPVFVVYMWSVCCKVFYFPLASSQITSPDCTVITFGIYIKCYQTHCYRLCNTKKVGANPLCALTISKLHCLYLINRHQESSMASWHLLVHSQQPESLHRLSVRTWSPFQITHWHVNKCDIFYIFVIHWFKVKCIISNWFSSSGCMV